MKNYLVTIIIASVGMSIFEILAPKTGDIQKYIRSIALLIILTVSVSPIINLIKQIDFSDLESLKNDILIEDITKDYQDILNEYLNSYSIDQIKDLIKETLNNEFAIPEQECEIRIETQYSNDQLSLKKITVLLMGKSIFKNPYNIENYISKLLGCECLVLVKDE